MKECCIEGDPPLAPKFHFWEGGGKCPSVSPRLPGPHLLGKEGLDGLGVVLGMGLARQDRNLSSWRWNSPAESPQLCNAGAFPSLYSQLF